MKNLATWKTMAITVVLLQLSFSLEIFCLSYHADRIVRLPGQPNIGFQQFSGYVTVDDMKHKALFYYFVESETDPASKPLVLWLNGGPGCSSLGVGAFSENGPFRPNGEVLIKNEYSWNRETNMLYLETPVGVGFSYAKGGSSYDTVNDETTVLEHKNSHYSLLSSEAVLLISQARDNLVFLQRWFNKFPHYRHTDLFLAGESYAGHYVPQLAKLMIEINKKEKMFNLKGIALGNPVLEYATDFNSRAEFFWSHGLISDSTYKLFTTGCNYSRYVSEYYRDSISPLCSKVMKQCFHNPKLFVLKAKTFFPVAKQQTNESIDVCVDDKVTNYLNRKDVQEALHAKLVGVQKWNVCSTILDYDMLNLEVPTLPIVGSLIKAGVRVLIYSGDQDSVIPLTGSRTLVQKLARQLRLNTTIHYRVWFEGQQVGGWTQVYGNILSFATVRGASHEAPFSQPERSLVLFKSFLEDRPLPEIF
ncbi:hypothetical protein JHK85_020556 [Glycine max]|nr:hypothetical protein JHK85_020556 [Glycine max]